MTTKAKARILIVEDESDIRQLMQMHLTREGHDPTGVEDGERALSLLASQQFDLAVVDWMLPGVSGIEICKKMAGKIPILMVTARADGADIVLGLEMGADDYITKPFEIPVFLARVRALLRRAQSAAAPRPHDIYSVGDLSLNLPEHKAWLAGEEIKLTLSEFKLLVALLDNRGRVLPREKLIDLVQGEGVNVTDRTIDTHVYGLRKKLGASAELIETIRGVGYRVRFSPES